MNKDLLLTPKPVSKLECGSAFYNNETSNCLNRTIVDFWQWAYSDLMQNTTRAVLAEYVVAVLLGCDDKPRIPWDAYDLKTKEGKTIEIKTMSQLQAWAQKRLSEPKVALSPTRKWNPLTGIMEETPSFNADLFVICYFSADSHDTANPLDLTQWEFFVFTKDRLIELIKNKKSISLKALMREGIKSVNAEALKSAIQELD
ncbi:MAG: hypothetical protein WCT32_01245 [Patescibacteria group bacterium]|jgi:hypothetical protein